MPINIYWMPVHIYGDTEETLEKLLRLREYVPFSFSEHDSYFFEFEGSYTFVIENSSNDEICYLVAGINASGSIMTLFEITEYQNKLKMLVDSIEHHSVSKDAQYFMDEIIRYFDPNCIDG